MTLKNINKILPEMSQPTEARQLDVDDLDKKHKKQAIIGILPEMGNTLMMMVMIMMTQRGIYLHMQRWALRGHKVI